VNAVVWLTGLSGSGKTTIARALEARLQAERQLVYVLDGDVIRRGLSSDLGFSDADRAENIRRAGHVAAMLADAGLIVITAFISPFRGDREQVREVIGAERFLEVFLDAPLDVCEQRDPKGLYAKARAGEIADFTGISSPYEPPETPALVLRTAEMDIDACVDAIHAELERR
jgi:adenylyl-sulfate kinase